MISISLFEKLIEPFQVLFERHKKRVVIALMIAVAVLNVVFILFPLGLSLYRNSSQIEMVKTEIHSVRGDQKLEDKLQESLKDMRAKLTKAEERAAVGDISHYLEVLSKLSQETNFKIITIQPVRKTLTVLEIEERTPVPYQYTQFEITANSGYHSLGKFVSRLENYPVLIKISTIRIDGIPSSPEMHRINLRIQMIQKNQLNKGK